MKPRQEQKCSEDQVFCRSQHDIQRAIDEVFESDYSTEAFSFEYKKCLPIEDAVNLAYPAYAPFLEPKSLVGKEEADIVSTLLECGRCQEWCDRAYSWLRSHIPAIVFVAIIQGEEETEYLLGDGHHRLALANAIGISEIGAVFVKLKKQGMKKY